MIAVILLLVPVKNSQTPNLQSSHQPRQAANDDVIEGEFHRED
jgi:UPF0716 protein FxsA